MNISYAQNYEDILISRLFKKDKGFYIDVGAAHPHKDSVTKYFYDRGWKGINIEPNGEQFSLLQKDRTNDVNLNCVALNKNGSVKFSNIASDPKISFVGENPQKESEHVYQGLDKTVVDIDARTLTSIYQEYAENKDVDFLKIDVEGAEEIVLEGIDFSVLKPRLIILESVGVKSDKKVDATRSEEILQNNGYQSVYFDGINTYYAQATDKEAIQAYSVPLNANDQPLSFQQTKLSFLLKLLMWKLKGK